MHLLMSMANRKQEIYFSMGGIQSLNFFLSYNPKKTTFTLIIKYKYLRCFPQKLSCTMLVYHVCSVSFWQPLWFIQKYDTLWEGFVLSYTILRTSTSFA